MTPSPPTVDVHAHVLLPEIEALVEGAPGLAEARSLDARRNGPAALAVSGPMVRERAPRMIDTVARLALMDAQGVDVQLVSPSPSPYHYWADETVAEKVFRLAGEATAAHCSAAPDRLQGLGLVPLQHPHLAVRALDHALEQGLRGAEISTTRLAGNSPTRPTSPSGPGPRRPARSSFCTPSAARWTNGWTAGTSPTRSASPWSTRSPCRT